MSRLSLCNTIRALFWIHFLTKRMKSPPTKSSQKSSSPTLPNHFEQTHAKTSTICQQRNWFKSVTPLQIPHTQTPPTSTHSNSTSLPQSNPPSISAYLGLCRSVRPWTHKATTPLSSSARATSKLLRRCSKRRILASQKKNPTVGTIGFVFLSCFFFVLGAFHFSFIPVRLFRVLWSFLKHFLTHK